MLNHQFDLSSDILSVLLICVSVSLPSKLHLRLLYHHQLPLLNPLRLTLLTLHSMMLLVTLSRYCCKHPKLSAKLFFSSKSYLRVVLFVLSLKLSSQGITISRTGRVQRRLCNCALSFGKMETNISFAPSFSLLLLCPHTLFQFEPSSLNSVLSYIASVLHHPLCVGDLQAALQRLHASMSTNKSVV